MDDISKAEYDNLTSNQKIVHAIEEDERDDSRVMSSFIPENVRLLWSSQNYEKLESIESSTGTVYKFNMASHWIKEFYMFFMLPRIEVKKKFKNQIEICYGHGPGYFRIKNMHIKIMGDRKQPINGDWCFAYEQSILKELKKISPEDWLSRTGSIPLLENWGTNLIPYRINFPIPFPFSLSEDGGMPLIYYPETSPVEINAEFRNDITSLIRMRGRNKIKLEDGSESWGPWKDMKPVLKYLDCKKIKLDSPEIWATYSQLSPKELEYMKNGHFESSNDNYNDSEFITTVSSANNNVSHTSFYFDDIVCLEASELKTYEEKSTVNLPSGKLVKAIYGHATNNGAELLNNYCNTTTNESNLYDGWSPISSLSLSYNDSSKFKDTDISHFDCGASIAGNFKYHLSRYPFRNPEVAVHVLKGSIVASIDNLDPHCYKNDTNEEEEDSEAVIIRSEDKNKDPNSRFSLRVFLLCENRMLISKKGEKFSVKII